MSTAALSLPQRRVPLLGLGWWITFASVLFVGLKFSWVAAVGVIVFAIIQRARPFDFLLSYLIVVADASIMDYFTGKLTPLMSIFTGLLLFSLLCYLLSRRQDALTFPVTPALRPLVLYLLLTLVNFVRGLAVGNKATYAGLELIAALGLGTCLIIGSRRLTNREIMSAVLWLWIVGLGHFARGVQIYAIEHIRVGGNYFEPVTGLIAVLMFNFALREPKRSRAVLWVLAIAPLLFHQFISFTRGFWMALAAAIPFSVVLYGGRGLGAGPRWRQAGFVLSVMMGFAVTGALAIATALGFGNIGEIAAGRFNSSFQTTYDADSLSNFVRLSEYLNVIGNIMRKPWFGYGLGFAFVNRELIYFKLISQWFTHDNYLLVTLKQGLIGLALWIWLMIAMLRTALKGRHLPDRVQQSWCMGTAAMAVYVIVYQFVAFPMAEVNTVFTFALGIGVTMDLTRTGTFAIRWKARPATASAPASG